MEISIKDLPAHLNTNLIESNGHGRRSFLSHDIDFVWSLPSWCHIIISLLHARVVVIQWIRLVSSIGICCAWGAVIVWDYGSQCVIGPHSALFVVSCCQSLFTVQSPTELWQTLILVSCLMRLVALRERLDIFWRVWLDFWQRGRSHISAQASWSNSVSSNRILVPFVLRSLTTHRGCRWGVGIMAGYWVNGCS